MSATAWKCRCATLELDYEKTRPKKPCGDHNQAYTCSAKRFFMSMIGDHLKVGGWVADCVNHECASHKADGDCAKHGENDWCDQCFWIDKYNYAYRCVGKVELCPFFKERTVDEWVRLVMEDSAPLLNRNGKVRPEGLAAKKHFKISDEDFARLIANKVKADKERAEEMKFAMEVAQKRESEGEK